MTVTDPDPSAFRGTIRPLPHEPDKVELLAAAAGITDGAADMDGALRRLADLLVPAFADAAWIDVLDPGGRLRRVAARIDHPDAEGDGGAG